MCKILVVIFLLLHSYLYAFEAGLAGQWEGQLLSAKRPIVLYLNFDKMIARMDVTGSQEIPLKDLSLEGAAIEFVISLSNEQLKFNGTMIGGQISGIETENNLSFALERLPDWPESQNRVEQWKEDIEAVLDRFLNYDRSYTTQQRKDAIKILRNLESALQNKSDEEIIVELSRAIARTNNAHTRLYLLRNRTELRRLPIRVWWMSDGLYVVKSTSANKDLLGCRVDKIGVHNVQHVRDEVSELFVGNETWTNYKSTYYITSPEILRGLKLVDDMQKIQFTFQCENNTKVKIISPLSFEKKTSPTEAWWDLTPEWKDDETWIHSLINKKIPLYLKNPHEHYWFELIEPEQAIYFQYNRAQNKKGAESLKQFGVRLLEVLQKRSIKKLIVDLRFNTGGDLNIARDLMENLKKEAAEKQFAVFVLVGRATFSAGISHAAQWKESSDAVFVGESVGDDLDFFSEGGNLILPNSKLAAHYANGFHTYSKTEFPQFKPYYFDMNVENLEPDQRIQLSSTDYFAGKDPVLDEVLNKP